MNLQILNHFQPLPVNIRIELVDESGKHYHPHEVNPVDYLSRFLNKCVVNKVCREMIARKKAGIIEVYQDKIVVKEN
ncbi:MAG TPA: hypothetical protein VFV08_12275 [Puia sp.]|nr:hypothetical protein [Puia sp.]